MFRPCYRVTGPFLMVVLILSRPVPILTGEEPASPPIVTSVAGLHVAKLMKFDNVTQRVDSGLDAIKVFVFVESRESNLVQLDKEKCSLKRFQDDKGTNLLTTKTRVIGSPFRTTRFANNPKAYIAEIRSSVLPASGARTLVLEGTLTFTAAEREEPVRVNAVKLTPGTSFTADGIPFTIEKAGEPQFGNDPLEVTLKAASNGVPVSKIRYLDATGQDITGLRVRTVSDEDSIQWTDNLKKSVDSVTVEVTFWKGIKEMEVPMKLEFGVGL